MKYLLTGLIVLMLFVSGCGEYLTAASEEYEETPMSEKTELNTEPSANQSNKEIYEVLPGGETRLMTELPEVAEKAATNGTTLRYTPEVKTSKEPLFVAGELDLSASTPDEIVIKVIYLDTNNQSVYFTIPGGEGRSSIRFWKTMPPPYAERNTLEGEFSGEKWGDWITENLIRTTDNSTFIEMMITSSNDIIKVPISTLLLNNNDIIVEFTIDPTLWNASTKGSNFGEQTLDKMGYASTIYGSLNIIQ